MSPTPSLEWFYNEIKDATLEVIERGKFCQAFRLRKYPDRDMMSSILIFTPYSTIITGDVRIESHGLQAVGYGLDWFRQKGMSANYLARKFLEEKWLPEKARQSFRGWADDIQETIDEELKEARKEAANDCNCLPDEVTDETLVAYLDGQSYPIRKWRCLGEEFPGTMADAIRNLLTEDEVFEQSLWLYHNMPDCWDEKKSRWHCPFGSEDIQRGYGYDPDSVGWLYAIQRRFAECYAELPVSVKE